MSVPIKFRGKLSRSAYNVKIYPPKILNAGTVVYGDLIHFRDGVLIRTEYDYYENKAIEYFVDPDSVAQLVGYDDDGKELYENDTVVDENGDEYRVCFERIAFGRFCALKFDDEIEYRGLFRLKTNDD